MRDVNFCSIRLEYIMRTERLIHCAVPLNVCICGILRGCTRVEPGKVRRYHSRRTFNFFFNFLRTLWIMCWVLTTTTLHRVGKQQATKWPRSITPLGKCYWKQYSSRITIALNAGWVPPAMFIACRIENASDEQGMGNDVYYYLWKQGINAEENYEFNLPLTSHIYSLFPFFDFPFLQLNALHTSSGEQPWNAGYSIV